MIAFLLLLAVLPTVELSEQVAHVIEHAFSAEVADHTAHHEEAPGDEHGCTGLIHLCGCHHASVTMAMMIVETEAIETLDSVAIHSPHSLVDLTTPEPAQRPPIA